MQTPASGGEVTVAGVQPGTVAESPDAGSTLGRYLVIRELGRGGMGVVLRAYDPKLQREVALKVLRTKSLTEDAKTRMVREARLMAKLSHPNVVAVYDVEFEHTQRVVIAMELVDGVTLEDWLEGERSWPEIQGRFVLAGRGLAAAHEAGILHRDFKPANVLVGRGEQRVLVTDFGLARTPDPGPVTPAEGVLASGSSASIRIADDGRTDLTKAGVVMGTPKYMSPEQHRGAELTAASDQYAFCVSLWRGLTGALPFEGPLEELAAGKNEGPPPWPKHAPAPRRTVEAIRRGLSPGPQDRWPSMPALLEALQPARRSPRWWVLGAGATLATAAVLWTMSERPATSCTGAAAQIEHVWSPEQRARGSAAFVDTDLPYAQASWTAASQLLDDYVQRWREAYTEACEATTIRGERSPATMDLQMVCLQRARRGLAGTVDVLTSADPGVVDKAVRIVESMPAIERCADLELLLAQVPPPSSAQDAQRVDEAEAALAKAKPLTIAGRFAEVAPLVEEAKRSMQGIEYAPTLVKLDMAKAVLLEAGGDFAEAKVAYEATMQSALAARQWTLAAKAAATVVTVAGARLAHYDEAYAFAQFASALIPLTEDPIEVEVALRNNVAITYELHGRLEEAEAEHRRGLALTEETYGPADRRSGKFRNNLGLVLEVQGRFDEALEQYEAARGIWEEAYGPLHPVVILIRGNIANIYFQQARFDEALAEQRDVLRTRIEVLGEAHPEVGLARANLGNTYLMLERFEEAEPEIRAALETMRGAYGPSHPDTLTCINALGQLLTHTERAPAAAEMLREATDSLATSLGKQADSHPLIVRLRGNLASALMESGRREEAIAEQRLSLQARVRSDGPAAPSTARQRRDLAQWLLEADRLEEAIALLEQALADVAPSVAGDPEAAEVHTALERLLRTHRAFPPPG